MRKLIDFQKPYISPIDLKPRFELNINLISTRLNYEELFDLKSQVDILIGEVRLIEDMFENLKDDPETLGRIIEERYR